MQTRGLRQMMGRDERGGLLSLSLSPLLRFYSPRLVEVRLVDGPVTVTVIFGQRCEIELNGCEKRSACVERWVGAAPARQRLRCQKALEVWNDMRWKGENDALSQRSKTKVTVSEWPLSPKLGFIFTEIASMSLPFNSWE